jgi:hypothetical protein
MDGSIEVLRHAKPPDIGYQLSAFSFQLSVISFLMADGNGTDISVRDCGESI